MNIAATDITNPTIPHELAAVKPAGDRFAQDLIDAKGRIEAGETQDLDADKKETLRKTAEQLVATTFIMPMLSKMREDPFKSDLFHGGQTEEIFGQRLDTILAERIVSKSDFSIVDAVYRSVADRAALTSDSQTAPGIDTHG